MDRLVIITGAGSGMGEATSILLNSIGYDLILIGRTYEKLKNVKDLLNNNYYTEIIDIDISDCQAVKDSFNHIFSERNVFSLVNCAGIISNNGESFLDDEMNSESNSIINVNIYGTINTNRSFIKNSLKYNCKSSIVNIASISSFYSGCDFPIYSLTKGSIISFSRAIALKYGNSGIRINTISPGVVKTPMSYIETPNFDDYISELSNDHPLGRIGKPQDVANMVKFLISDEANWITGQDFIVDGGFTLGV